MIILLQATNLTKTFGGLVAVSNVDIHVGLVGPNGAGKTTIVKTIMGLLKPTSGTIEFNQNPIHLAPTHQIVEGDIALVPEGRELLPRLEERQKQSAGTMSGGEQQMLAIARGLMSRPKLLILDEPSLGLAPIMVKKMFGIVKSLNSEGVTVLLVEQNIHHALEASNRGYVLETGRITLEGASSELLDNNHVKEAYLGM